MTGLDAALYANAMYGLLREPHHRVDLNHLHVVAMVVRPRTVHLNHANKKIKLRLPFHPPDKQSKRGKESLETRRRHPETN